MAKIMLFTALLTCSGVPAAADQVSALVDRPSASSVVSIESHDDATRRAWIGRAMERLLSTDADAAAQANPGR